MEALVGEDLLEQAEAIDAAGLVLRQEDHSNSVPTLATEIHARLGCNVAQETVRDLNGEAGTVAGVLLRTRGAAVLEVHQDSQGITDGPV